MFSSFFKKGEKGELVIHDDIKSRDLGISFLKSYDYFLRADYVCVLHPLSYLIKQSNFNSLKNFRDNYKLIDGIIISSSEFEDTSKSTHFPIIIALYKRDVGNGMTWQEIKSFKFKIWNSKYSFSINQFLYIEDFHTKYKDKTVEQPYYHFFTLRDMNQLTINSGYLDFENSQSIRIKPKNKKYFDYLVRLKKWFSEEGKKEFWFLGNLSPIIINEFVGTNPSNADFTNWFRNELTKLEIINNKEEKIIWRFSNIGPTNKYRFKRRKVLWDHPENVSNSSKGVTKDCYLEVQIGYDKKIEDFYEKRSINKINFKNYNNDQKFIFELSDIICCGLINNFINLDILETLLKEVGEINENDFLENKKSIKRLDPEVTSYLMPLKNFYEVDILKPNFLKTYSNYNDFLEINIDYKQKAVGTQALLFLNISAQNLYKEDNTLLFSQKDTEFINKKDILYYVIDSVKYKIIFCELMTCFARLSKQHNTDITRIIQSIINEMKNENIYEELDESIDYDLIDKNLNYVQSNIFENIECIENPKILENLKK